MKKAERRRTLTLTPVTVLAGVLVLLGAAAFYQTQRAQADGANIVVNTTADTDDGACTALSTGNGCTLREAMTLANAASSAQTISFEIPAADAGCVSGVCTVNLTAALPAITQSVTIAGPGANLLTVQRSTGGDYRVFHVTAAAPSVVTFSGLSIKNGAPTGSDDTNHGGGIYNQQTGTVNVTACTISGNAATGYGGGICNFSTGTMNISGTVVSGNFATQGGGIHNDKQGGTTNVTASTISGNTGYQRGGGICMFAGTFTVTGSTVSGNRAGTSGGGIHNGLGFSSNANLTLANSTVSGNSATDAGGIWNAGQVLVTNSTVAANSAAYFGGVHLYTHPIIQGSQSTVLRSSIVALNTPADLSGPINSAGFNVIGMMGTVGASFTPQATDQTGVTKEQLNLGPLANNGGPTQTHALLACSPAIDNGNSFSLATDQRGAARVFNNPNVTPVTTGGDSSDVGAFESQEVPTVCTNPPTASASPNPVVAKTRTPVQITLTGTDINDNPLSFQITQQPAHGTLTGQAAAPSCSTASGTRTCALTVTYTAGSYNGGDSFKFTVNNGVAPPEERTANIFVTGNLDPDFFVNTTADTDDGVCSALGTGNGCTLREAISFANSAASAQTIGFAIPNSDPGCVAGVCTINLTGPLPAIRKGMTVSGPGADLLTVRRDTGGDYRIFTVLGDGAVVVTISGLSIKDGRMTSSAFAYGGGGIWNQGSHLNVTACIISGNTSYQGGGIGNYSGTLNVTDSTISGNFAADTGGGIYDKYGKVNVTQSTISGNTASQSGGGFYSFGVKFDDNSPGTVIISKSTIVFNTSSEERGGGIYKRAALNPDVGSGEIPSETSVRNSIVALNSAPAYPRYADVWISLNVETSIFSTDVGDSSSLNNVTAAQLNLGPLAFNGGHTPTHALLPGSVAIDRAYGDAATADQRGFPRPVDDLSIPNISLGNGFVGNGMDAGAYEAPDYSLFRVTTAVDELDPESNPGGGTGLSLREALRRANSLGAGTHAITFAQNLAGQTLTLGSAWSNTSADESTSALVVDGTNIIIQGPITGPGITLKIAPGANLRHFFVSGTPNTSLTLSDLTLTGGNPQLSGSNNGGAISAQGPLTVRNCTFTGNSSGAGGALHSASGAPSLLVENSTFSDNTSGGQGAAISAAANQITFRHLTVTNNTGGGSAISLGSAATMVNTIVAGNASDSFEIASGGSFTTQTTNNLCGAAAVPGLTSGSNNNYLGVPLSRLFVGPLQANGGPTATIALLPGSIATNRGVAVLATDQRGVARSAGGLPDIGAYEDATGNDDPDGDSLSNFQEWSIGSDSNSIDGDGDGFNDATEMLSGTDPASAASIPPNPHVERVFGYGPARGLDLTGNFVYAFNVGTNGAVGQAGDANFTADNAAGITMSAPNQVNPWGAPNFGSAAADDVLEKVYKSIRWANSADADPAKRRITVDLSGLTVGRRYKMQLLFGESCCNRNFDISVEGSLVADDFKPALAQGSLSLTKTGSAFVHEFVAGDTTLNIVLDASNTADPSLDRNPILNGVTLELLPDAIAPVITPAVGVARTQGNSATNSVIANNISDSQQAANTLTATVNGQSASGGNSVTSNGVTISNLVIAANGTATADVAAACNATTPSVNFTLRVANSAGLFSEATLDVTVNTPAANHLGFGQQPANTAAGQSITPAVTVVLLNQCNAVVNSNASVTMGIGTNPAGGTLGGTTTVAAAGGTATFSNLSINKAGAGYTLSATSGSLAGATSGGFNINAGAAAGISATAGTPQSASINSAFATAMQATVRDGAGNPVSGVTVTFTAPGSGASGKFANNLGTTTAVTDAGGVATASLFTANGTAGTYNVGASINAGSTSTTFSLTNTQANQTITVATPAPSSAVYNTSFTVAATASSGLTVSYGSSGSCTNTGATFTMTSSTGTCTVKYDQAGDGSYNAATQVTESVTAQKANQTITFNALPSKTFGDADFAVSATASSTLAVTFAAAGECTVTPDGSAVHITGAGSCTITTSQGGGDNYNAAPDVQQSFNIAKATTATAVTSSVNPSETGQSVTFTATVTSTAGTTTGKVTFKDGASAISACSNLNLVAGKATCTSSGLTAGNHTITADYIGDLNFNTSTGTLSGGQQVNANSTISISDVSLAEGNSGTQSFGFTVTLSQASNLTVNVDFATANGTATVAGGDYQSATGTLTFNPGDLTKTITVVVNGDTQNEANGTFFVNLSNPQNATISDNQGLGTILNDDAPGVQFSNNAYSVSEAVTTGVATITVNRSGDLSSPMTVDYQTSDQSGTTPCQTTNTGIASDRCDYATATGLLQFAAGEAQKTIQIVVVNDGYVEGPEQFTIKLLNAQGGALGTPDTATATITDNDAQAATTNPIGDLDFFLFMQYMDFLGRVPDPAGFAFWKQRMTTSCPQGDTCDRIDASFRFFSSDEFKERGLLVYTLYHAGLGRRPTYSEWIQDVSKLNGFKTMAEQEAAKDAYVNEFINRQGFLNLYQGAQTGQTFVDALIQKAGVTPQSRQALIDSYATAGRVKTIRAFMETAEVQAGFFDRAFVSMLYFGYLRRDAEPGGFDFWMQKLIETNRDYRFLIGGFLQSDEYHFRFALIPSAP